MSTGKDNPSQLTPEEYFVWESQQLEKYEYIDGQVHGIIGSSVNHGRIAVQLITSGVNHLEGSGCDTGNSDLRVNIVGTNNYTHPDVSVTCDFHEASALPKRDKTTTQYITYPCLIVEVLSAGTEAYDRGGKFRMYRKPLR